MTFQNTPKEFGCCGFIASGLEQDIENFSPIINGMPETHFFSIDLQKRLINMPSQTGLGSLGPKLFRLFFSKFLSPSADCLVGDIYAPL